ncbi:hypothetical protein DPMN_074420 [Dreissena polymorpha]|uniref:Uncharacterized protein n=1 Tax=Dreissena polymorpha TaxID=45954 RepID=A0A9D3YF81_DREPO|nr:hypothetical protein DPMN_074420 [Dreissena polymorpha]
MIAPDPPESKTGTNRDLLGFLSVDGLPKTIISMTTRLPHGLKPSATRHQHDAHADCPGQSLHSYGPTRQRHG